jgi:carboxyl-terminal processing protease
VTRGRYYTVSGHTPQLHGVQADIVVPGALSKLDMGEQFEKYPLDSDTIHPMYLDTLSDLPVLQRIALGKSYREKLQKKSLDLVPLIEPLRNNSALRIANNPGYQKFLESLEPEEENLSELGVKGEDPQLQEALNVLRDLVILDNSKSSPTI